MFSGHQCCKNVELSHILVVKSLKIVFSGHQCCENVELSHILVVKSLKIMFSGHQCCKNVELSNKNPFPCCKIVVFHLEIVHFRIQTWDFLISTKK